MFSVRQNEIITIMCVKIKTKITCVFQFTLNFKIGTVGWKLSLLSFSMGQPFVSKGENIIEFGACFEIFLPIPY